MGPAAGPKVIRPPVHLVLSASQQEAWQASVWQMGAGGGPLVLAFQWPTLEHANPSISSASAPASQSSFPLPPVPVVEAPLSGHPAIMLLAPTPNNSQEQRPAPESLVPEIGMESPLTELLDVSTAEPSRETSPEPVPSDDDASGSVAPLAGVVQSRTSEWHSSTTPSDMYMPGA